MPKAKCEESAVEKLGELYERFIDKEDLVTQDLFPSIQSIVDYFEMIEHYGAESLLKVRGSIEGGGANPKVYHDFVKKHRMPLKLHKPSLVAR